VIQISATVDGEGRLRSLSAEGHSFRKGGDFSPACAAVTALLRTAAGLLEAEPDVETHVSLPAEGSMVLNVGKIPNTLTGRYRGITDFLICGLARISQEAPEDLDMRVIHESI
jgi:uncharacterized protein YsxB (DUF464 family)